ncbi:MAG TPA: hypothetical protein DCL38_09925 [Lachnospiraceae bacterium]|nr:hypothetical protein [Lachnospiraceae bacterium]
MDFSMDNEKEIYEWASGLCASCGKDRSFLDELFRRFEEYPALYEEFKYFYDKDDFLCSLSVQGITVTDILIWQTDRFKAALDEGRFGLKYDRNEMILMAFYTMYEVIKDPGSFLARFREETGTDYYGKTACFTKPR